MPDDTVLNLTTKVHIEPVVQGMREAAAAVNANVSKINSEFREMMARATAAGNAVLAQAAGFRASGLSAEDTAAALKNLGYSTNEAAAAVATLNGAMGSVDASLASFRAAVKASMDAVSDSVQQADAKVGESLGRMRGRLILTQGGFRVSASGMANNMYLMGAAVAAAIGEQVVKKLIEGENAMANFAQATNIPIATIAEFQAVLDGFGAKEGAAQSTLKALQDSIVEAGQGSKTTAEEFKNVGINVEEWHGIMPNIITILGQLSEYLAQNKGNVQATAAVMRLLHDETGAVTAALQDGQSQLFRAIDAQKGLGTATAQTAATTRGLTTEWENFSNKLKGEGLRALEFFTTESKEMRDSNDESVKHIHDAWLHFWDGVHDKFVAASHDLEEFGDKEKTAVREAQEDAADAKTMADALAKLRSTPGGIQSKPGVPELFNLKDAVGQKDAMKALLEKWTAELGAMLETQATDERQAAELTVQFWEKTKQAAKGNTNAVLLANKELQAAQKQLSHEELTELEQRFENEKAEVEKNGTWTVEMTAEFWRKVLSTHKFSEEDRLAVTRKINAAIGESNKLSLEERIAIGEEIVAADRKGSAAALADAVALRDAVVSNEHASAEQKISANRLVLRAQLDFNQEAVNNVIRASDEEVAQYKAGDARIVESRRNALNQIKNMLTQVESGNNALGQPQQAVGLLSANATESSNLQIKMLENEISLLKEKLDQMQKSLAESEKGYTEHVDRESHERTQLREDEAQKSAEVQIQNIDRAASEEEKVTERAAQYDLISFGQKIARLQQLATSQRDQTRAILETELAQAEADNAAGKSEEDRESAMRRIISLQAQLERVTDQYYQRMQQISDQFYEHLMQRAEQAAGVISESFTRSFGTFLTEHTNMRTVLQKFWVDMVQGFAQMELQMVAKAIQGVAMRTIAEATGVQQVTTLHAAGASEAAAVTEAGSIRQVLASAKSAAAGAYSALAGIPVVGPALGAAAAAAVFAAVLAIGGTGGSGGGGAGGGTVGVDATGGVGGGIPGAVSAAGGALVHSDGLFQLHEGEVVVPKVLSQMLLDTGSIEQPDHRTGAPSSLIDQYGIKMTDAKLPDYISQNITNAFTNSTAVKQYGAQSSISTAMSKMLQNVSFSMASAAGGMDVPHDMVAQIHEKETVLPEHLSTGIKGLIEGGGTGKSVTNHIDHHQHFNISLQANSNDDMKKLLDEELVPRVKRAARRNKLNLKDLA